MKYLLPLAFIVGLLLSACSQTGAPPKSDAQTTNQATTNLDDDAKIAVVKQSYDECRWGVGAGAGKCYGFHLEAALSQEMIAISRLQDKLFEEHDFMETCVGGLEFDPAHGWQDYEFEGVDLLQKNIKYSVSDGDVLVKMGDDVALYKMIQQNGAYKIDDIISGGVSYKRHVRECADELGSG